LDLGLTFAANSAAFVKSILQGLRNHGASRHHLYAGR